MAVSSNSAALLISLLATLPVYQVTAEGKRLYFSGTMQNCLVYHTLYYVLGIH